jgi:hypothetical protein
MHVPALSFPSSALNVFKRRQLTVRLPPLPNKVSARSPAAEQGPEDAIDFYFRCDLADHSQALIPDERMGSCNRGRLAFLVRLRSAMRLGFPATTPASFATLFILSECGVLQFRGALRCQGLLGHRESVQGES